MRISELTTRSAKLNTGTAYFPVDQSSDTVTNKIDYAELAKQIITEYNTQTLAGAAQSVKAALDTIGANYKNLGVGTAISSGTDMDTITTVGNYISAGGAITNSLLNCPVTGYGFRLTVEAVNTTGVILQKIASGHNPSKHYERRGQVASNVWSFSTWEQKPTRAEIDAVSTVETITAEVNTDEVTSAGWSIVIKKVGNVVSINGYVILANPTKTNVGITLATLPQNVRPSVAIRTIAGVAAHAYEQPEGMCYAGVETNGLLSVRLQTDNLAKNNNVYMSISYII